MVVIIDDRFSFQQHIGADDALHGFGLVIAQRLVDMRQIEDHQIEIQILPCADPEFVAARNLRKHTGGSGSGGLGFRMSGGELEQFDAAEIDATVRRARVEDEISLDSVDLGANEQVLRLGNPKLDLSVFFLFEDFVQIFHKTNNEAQK